MTLNNLAFAPVLEPWARRYLELLGVDQSAPGFAALSALVRADVQTVPFENVTSLLRRQAQPAGQVPPLDSEALLTAWERGVGGGVCFEVTAQLSRLLPALGYDAQPVLGRASFPGSHQAVVVTLAGRRYVVDAANGSPFYDPIPLDGDFEVHVAGLGFRFHAGDRAGTWVQERLLKGEWARFCTYELTPSSAVDWERAYQRHHIVGESFVVSTLRIVRCFGDELLAISDSEFLHFTVAGKRSYPIADDAELQRLALNELQLPALPVVAGASALAELLAGAGPRRVPA